MTHCRRKMQDAIDQKSTVIILDQETTMQPKKKKETDCQKVLSECRRTTRTSLSIFFLATLCVGQAYVDHALSHSQDGTFCGEDGRGKHSPANKTSVEDRARGRQHIASFPAMESHFCRQS